MEQIVIRDISDADEEWVKVLFDKNKSILGSFSMTWFRFSQSKNENEKWVVIEGIGFAHYLIKRNGESTLYEIAVDDNYKKKGYGKALLDHIGFPMELKTDSENVESNEFYKKYKFICVGKKKSKNGKKEFNVYKRWA